MSKTKKPLPVDQTGSGEDGQLSLGGVRLPENHCSTGGDSSQEIAALLLRGSGNAIPLQHLQLLTGLDGRTVRRKIHAERRRGMCICEDNRRGYFLAENEAERDACARSMQHRAAEIQRTAEAIARSEVAGDGC